MRSFPSTGERPAYACRTFTGRHRFEPRFSVREEPSGAKISYYDMDPDKLRALTTLQHETYHGDVCKHCGMVVNAQPPEKS